MSDMSPRDPTAPDQRLTAAFTRPARIVAAVLRILLALGFAIALVLKVYMIVLTDYACEEGVTSLGNTIRCTSVLTLLGQALALSAALEFALRLMIGAPRRFVGPLTQALIAFLVLFLARIDLGQPTWESALFLLAAAGLLFGVLWMQGGVPGRGPGGRSGGGSGQAGAGDAD